jgi:hypothetical protein
MRGVFHTQSDPLRATLIENLRRMLGRRGVFFYVETNYDGSPLDMITSLATPSGDLPDPLFRTIQAGLPIPRHFGEREHRTWFPAAEWETIACGPTEIHGVAMSTPGDLERHSAWQAIVKPR